MYNRFIQKLFMVIFATLTMYSLQSVTAHAQGSNIDWNGWTFEYEIGVANDGIAIKDVRFNGKEILARGNFPAMPVYYENNTCGPYLDRLDGDLVTVPWANNARVVSREFTTNGEQWYELGIRQFIGQYDIYQVWYFNGAGVIDAHLFSRGLQCNVYHEHWPQWRFDFDIAGADNDQILRQTSNGLQAYNNEFNVNATEAINHGWVVRDTITNDQVTLDFDSGTWSPSGTVVAATQYAKNRVAGRKYNDAETDWHTSGHSSLPSNWNDGVDRIGYGNNENINNTDVVLWYSGYLPHSASEGSSLWHSTGVRITLQSGGSTPAPTAAPNPTAAPPAAPTAAPTAAPPTGSYRYVRLVAESEVNGNPWTSMAEFNVLDGSGYNINRNGWYVRADSEETAGEDGRATRAIDGYTNTFWHTEWSASNPVHPHEFIVDMGRSHTVSGFRYLPRPGGGNGNISAYKFYVSNNDVNWGAPVAQGTFANSTAEKTVRLDDAANPIATPTPAPQPTATPVPNNSTILGDVTCDGVVNMDDAYGIWYYTLGSRTDAGTCPLPAPYTMINASVADVDGNGYVDISDAYTIHYCELGFSNSFCP